MTNRCKHCATSYPEGSGVDGFCCAGCRQVYELIQQEGLGDYYRQQDRVAQPLKDRALTELDAQALRRAQSQVENGAELAQAEFEVEGMSCMGCAWLVERLGHGQAGLVKTVASLSRHSVLLEWRSAEFDLSAFGGELFKFGYRIHSRPQDPGVDSGISPLALRFFLTFIFTGNSLLLAAYALYGTTTASEGSELLSLLCLICLCFVLLLGAAPFFLSVYRAFQIRHWHSDWLPVAFILTGTSASMYQYFFSYLTLSLACFIISLLVCVLIGARWLAALISKR